MLFYLNERPDTTPRDLEASEAVDRIIHTVYASDCESEDSVES